MNVKQKKAMVCSFLLSGLLLFGSVVYADNNGGININISNNPNISNETNVESNNTNTNTSTNENNNTNNNENNNTNNNENNNDNQNSNTNTNTNTNENDNGPNKPKPKPKPNKNIDGSATITYLGSYQVKVSGWTNTDRVSVTIGSTTYQISVTNPKNERKDFTDTHTLPTSYNGTYQASIYAFNAKNSQRKKQIGTGSINITKPTPDPSVVIEGQASVTDQGNGKAKISGWTNTDRVKVTIGNKDYALIVTNPKHEKKNFEGICAAPSTAPGTYPVVVAAYNAANTSKTKQIGTGNIVIKPNTPPVPSGNATLTYLGDYKVKVTGQTNTDHIRVNIGTQVYSFAVKNPQHTMTKFEEVLNPPLPSSFVGNYTGCVYAYNSNLPSVTKEIGRGNFNIPKSIPPIDGKANFIYSDIYKVRVNGWANTDHVKINLANETYEITLDNPDHTQKTFDKEYTSPSFVENFEGHVYAYNSVNASQTKEIGKGNFYIPKPVPSPDGNATVTYIGNNQAKVDGWTNTDHVTVKIGGQKFDKNVTNPNHDKITFSDTYNLPESMVGQQLYTVNAENLSDMNNTKQIGVGSIDIPIPAHDPEFRNVSANVVNYNHLVISGEVYDQDDMSQNIRVNGDFGGGKFTIIADKGNHRFEDDIEIHIPETHVGNFVLTLEAENIKGGKNTSLNLGEKRVESPIINATGIRIARGTHGIADGAIVELLKENRATGQYYASYNNGRYHWAFGGNEGWISKDAVDPYPCRWGRVITQDGRAFVYSDEGLSNIEKTSKGNQEKVWNDPSGIGLLIIGEKGNAYRLRYHSLAAEDNIVKERWVSKSDMS